MWNLERNDINELTYKTERNSDLENELMVAPGRRNREFGKDMYTLLYLKWITNKKPLHSMWNSVQCCVAAWMGGVWRRTDTCVCIWMYG